MYLREYCVSTKYSRTFFKHPAEGGERYHNVWSANKKCTYIGVWFCDWRMCNWSVGKHSFCKWTVLRKKLINSVSWTRGPVIKNASLFLIVHNHFCSQFNYSLEQAYQANVPTRVRVQIHVWWMCMHTYTHSWKAEVPSNTGKCTSNDFLVIRCSWLLQRSALVNLSAPVDFNGSDLCCGFVRIYVNINIKKIINTINMYTNFQ